MRVCVCECVYVCAQVERDVSLSGLHRFQKPGSSQMWKGGWRECVKTAIVFSFFLSFFLSFFPRVVIRWWLSVYKRSGAMMKMTSILLIILLFFEYARAQEGTAAADSLGLKAHKSNQDGCVIFFIKKINRKAVYASRACGSYDLSTHSAVHFAFHGILIRNEYEILKE